MLYLMLAEGFEEVEAVAPLDVLRRAGVPVKTVGVTGAVVRGSHGIPVDADLTLDAIQPEDCQGVVLPGGLPGTDNLRDNSRVTGLLQQCFDSGRLVAAICAAPSILGELGILRGKRATCFPGYEEKLEGAVPTGEPVVRDGAVITAKGAGAALEFGAALADYFCGPGTGTKILAQMQAPGYDA